VYGNLINLLPDSRRDDVKLPANVVVTVLVLAFASTLKLRWSDLGIERRTLGRAGWGFVLGAALATPLVLFILVAPFFTGESVGTDDTERPSFAGLIWRVAVRVLVGTAIPEELLFRGLLFALWLRASDLRGAVVATAAAFGLWHAVISFDTVSNVGLDNDALFWLAYGVTLIGLSLGGVLFALVRRHTDSLAAPVALHWTVNAMAIIAVWVRG
jgi:membrane protease YdiL (CAAX protease family)